MLPNGRSVDATKRRRSKDRRVSVQQGIALRLASLLRRWAVGGTLIISNLRYN